MRKLLIAVLLLGLAIGSLEPETAEAMGQSIVMICSTWLIHETVNRKVQP